MGLRELIEETRRNRDAAMIDVARPDADIGPPMEFDPVEGTARPIGFSDTPADHRPFHEPPSYPESEQAGYDRADRELTAIDNAARARVAASRQAPRPAAPRMESGVLPGEEQVTTKDSLGHLTPEQRAALRSRYATSGSKASFDDWASDTFGELPPRDRLAEMTDAPAAPSPPPPLTPEQQREKRDVTHNFLRPEIPMLDNRGTFIRNPDGSRSMRAPDPEMMKRAEAFSSDQYWTPEFNRVLGAAYGINVNHPRYHNNEDLLRDDVLNLHAEHERQAAVSRVEDTGAKKAGRFAAPVVTGRMRYVADPDKAARVRDERDANMPMADKMRLARGILTRFRGFEGLTPEVRTAIESATSTPDGFAQLRAINEALHAQREEMSAEAARSRATNFNLTRDLNNNNLNTGMRLRSLLAEAERANPRPLVMAVLNDAAGNPRAADQMRMAELESRRAAAEMAAMTEQARIARDANRPYAEQIREQLVPALREPNPARRQLMVEKVVASTLPPNPDGTPVSPAVVREEAARQIAAHVAATNPSDPIVARYLESLSAAGKQAEFEDFAVAYLGMTREQARDKYAASGRGWSGLGRRAVRGMERMAGR